MLSSDKIRLYIKFLFSRERELYLFFSRTVGCCPRDISLYKLACTHRSLMARSESGERLDNERLEYLGDAVLDTIVSEMLYRIYRRGNEGFLTNARSKIVKRETLNMLARTIGLTERLHYARQSYSHNCNMGGNALEALIGAVYLDLGYNRCRSFVVDRLIAPHIDVAAVLKQESNYKSRLIEWAQKYQVECCFRLIEEVQGTDNSPVFFSSVSLSGVEAGKGSGFSKRESQQQAAQEAFGRLRGDRKFRAAVLASAAGNAPEKQGCPD